MHMMTLSRLRTRGAAIALALGGLAALGAAPAQAEMPGSFADLVDQVTPAVVNISTTRETRGPSFEGLPEFKFDLPPGSPFEEFFERFRERWGEQGPNAPRRGTGLGSGFIVDPSGYVVTNNHVIDGANEVKVTLVDGRQFTAELVGRDPKTDLALLKIESSERLPHVEWGDSDAVRVGDWVVAVGNPYGLGGTVTVGVISARGRDIGAGPFDDFLQIDASINQGNSGGPTFSTAGRVIGVNTAIFSPTGGSVGIGFAIPSNMARAIIDELRQHGRVERGWLGVQIQQVTPEMAEALGLERPMGAIVAQVTPDSPAAKAGVRQGDVILSFNGTEVGEMRQLPRLVAAANPNSAAELVVWRDGARKRLTVSLGRMEPEPETASVEQPAQEGSGQSLASLGATLAPITPELRREFDLPEGATGVLVLEVEPEGPAARQGLRPGDVIERVAQTPVDSPEDIEPLVAAAREGGKDVVLLLVQRQGNSLFMALKLA